MESMISLGQKNTLAGYMILSSADNRPPMLDKDLVIGTKKYAKLSATEKIQVDYDMKATNIILQGDDPIACLNKAMDFLIALPQGTGYKSNANSSRGNNSSGTAREKAMLAEAQEAVKILDEEQLAFLVDPGVPDGQVLHTIIPNNAAFQIEDHDTYY
uniref:Uncharacterized protein n=1 Tax=Tanacetum cinerariifolium TaxID=118510 RepID=A0A6L2MRS8_TANCI|nr:hypothetical protein [Tanacetum cinerariifolium]